MNHSPRPTAAPGDRAAACRAFAKIEWKCEKSALVRISQNVLTCPTAACFNLIDSPNYFKMGRKVAYFGDGYQKRIERFGRKMWWIPTLGGEFILDRRLGYADGLMGGNLLVLGESEKPPSQRLRPALRPSTIAGRHHALSWRHRRQRIQSRQQIQIRLRQHLRKVLSACLMSDPTANSALPDNVRSVMEIIINGHDLATIIAPPKPPSLPP